MLVFCKLLCLYKIINVNSLICYVCNIQNTNRFTNKITLIQEKNKEMCEGHSYP